MTSRPGGSEPREARIALPGAPRRQVVGGHGGLEAGGLGLADGGQQLDRQHLLARGKPLPAPSDGLLPSSQRAGGAGPPPPNDDPALATPSLVARSSASGTGETSALVPSGRHRRAPSSPEYRR